MSLLANILGYGAFGFASRCFQLGLQKRGMFDAPLGHVYATGAFGLLGYGVYVAKESQKGLLAEKKKDLLAIRERENREYEEKKAAAAHS